MRANSTGCRQDVASSDLEWLGRLRGVQLVESPFEAGLSRGEFARIRVANRLRHVHNWIAVRF